MVLYGTGFAVISVMLVTTCLMSLVIVLCWHQSVFFAICFVFFFGTIEALYFSASLVKFHQGAWVPVALGLCFFFVMYVWHYGTVRKYEFEVQNKVSINCLLSLGPSLGIVRVRGIGLIHTELVSGIPAIFSHFVTNLPAFHQVLVFLCIKSVPVPHVRPEERFLVGQIGPREYRLYRCIVRYGYRDVHKDDVGFENDLVCSIAEFLRSGSSPEKKIMIEDFENENGKMTVVGTRSTHADGIQLSEDNVEMTPEITTLGQREIRSPPPPVKQREIRSPPPPVKQREIMSPPMPQRRKKVRFIIPESPKIDTGAREELRELMEAREAGVAYIVGNTYMNAKKGSSWMKRFAIDYGYEFLRRNSRTASYALNIPHASTLEVGMIYHV